MGITCLPISFFVGLLQLSIDVLFFFLSIFNVAAAPNLSDSIGSIVGCNV